ncbi:hypothetical protein V9T40_006750 [Parthenolecanium corni]|uniref:Uncharacterized protein n=1 Tax=Parthenolecanium corni TaxID=536013 RepID=A0AAN9TTU8_9HEMI
MSLTSKITLGASVVFLAGTIIYDFYDKEIQKALLHRGVVKDLARQELQAKNLRELNRQIMVEEQYRTAMAEKEAKSKTE